MKKIKILLYLFMFSLFTFSCEQELLVDEKVILGEITCDSINEVEILRLVNQFRTVGYILEDDTNKFITSLSKPLTWDNKLKIAASIHSTYMVETNDYSHTWSDGTSLSKRIYWSGFENNAKEGITASENIARGHKNELSVINGWLNSKPHRDAMLSNRYDVFAVAKRTHPEGMTYWTMVLAYKGHKL